MYKTRMLHKALPEDPKRVGSEKKTKSYGATRENFICLWRRGRGGFDRVPSPAPQKALLLCLFLLISQDSVTQEHICCPTTQPRNPLRAVCGAAVVTQLPYKAPGQHKSSGTATVTQIFPFGHLDIFDAVSKGDKNQGCVGWFEMCRLAASSSVARFTAVPQW